MASIFLEEAIARHLGPDDDLLQQLQHDNMVGKRQLFTTQPRQQKMRPIVSEFGYVLQLAVSLKAAQTFVLDHNSPKGSKIISRQVQQGFSRDVFLATPHAKMASEILDGETFELIKVGVPRDPQQL